jgi:hypothetical protein
MKTKNIFFITAVCFSILLTSCEKGIDTVEYDSTVYLPSNGIREVAPLLGESIYQIGLLWAGINQKESGITVYLKVDADSLARYLAVNRQSNFKLLPEMFYDIPTTTVNLSGERSLVNIRFKNIDERFVDNDYILPISIESVSPLVNVDPRRKTIFLNLTRYRNIYEGVYKGFGPISDDNNEVVSKVDKDDFYAVTVNANTIVVGGPEPNMNIVLTIKSDGMVEIGSAPGSASFLVQNLDGYESVYKGEFDHRYQRSWGVFDLYYQYVLGGANMYVHAELRSWH